MSASRFQVGGVRNDRDAESAGTPLNDAAGPAESERRNLGIGRTRTD
jgi:hypothetical protein